MSGLKKYLIFGSLLVIIYLVAQYYRPKPINWNPTYLSEDKIPFGTFVLRQRIGDIFPNAKVNVVESPIYNTLNERTPGKSNLIIIGGELKVDRVDYQEMLRYMKAGNSIFIASEEIKGVLLDSLKLTIEANFFSRSNRRFPINFVNPLVKRELDYYFDSSIGGQYFSKVDRARAIVLGEKEKQSPNFIEYKFGKGSLFIMPNPRLLTNYTVLKDDGMDYASKALSYLPLAETVLWNEHFTKRSQEDRTDLSVIFRYGPLRWAYLIALISLFIFILFEIKRRQRIIPIVAPLKNTTVEFTETVGRVYYQQRDNRDIAEKKVIYLMEYIRTKYRIKTTTLDQEFKETLIKITGATSDTIEELFVEIVRLSAGYSITDKDLIQLNKKIEKFYKEDQ